MSIQEIEEKLDLGKTIKCPHCHSKDTLKIHQEGLSYQYRCNTCLKISLIDINLNGLNINGNEDENELVFAEFSV